MFKEFQQNKIEIILDRDHHLIRFMFLKINYLFIYRKINNLKIELNEERES